MKRDINIYRSFYEVKYDKNTILTVGTFDGVHKGHQKILDRLKEIAQKDNLRAIVLTIDPHPQIVLQKNDKRPIKILSLIDERIALFNKFGISNVLVIPFTYSFSLTSPEEFVRKYLAGYVGFSKILIGYDHLFGNNRKGDFDLLMSLGEELNFNIEKMEPLQKEDVIISSTKIRVALENCDLEHANAMLGYTYFADGEVVYGAKRGSAIGYPTANIKLPDRNKLLPGNGVYLVSSAIANEKVFGMANIGLRPTFTDDTEPTLEVHYFDFDKDIYGERTEVQFHKFIRKERKFSNVGDLTDQIKKDEILCRSLIK